MTTIDNKIDNSVIKMNGKIVTCDRCDKNATNFIGMHRVCSVHKAELINKESIKRVTHEPTKI